jgi:aminoglycoside phosphotransferase (APT) family kinase protein
MNIEINDGLVRQLVNDQFPQWCDLEIKPVATQGWDNRTFHLGSDMTVRLPSSESYAPQAEKEQDWIPILSSMLPFQVPVLLAKGKPSEVFPYKWGIYKWLDGENLELESINDISKLAKDLAHFLNELQKIDTSNAPLAGQHCFYRGAPLSVYDTETKRAIQNLSDTINAKLAIEIWDKAVMTKWERLPVWFHGDIAKGNLLTKNGELYAVIDFGCCGVGDPACDLSIAWTFFSEDSRQMFKTELDLDEHTWQRGRAWALWKALITVEQSIGKTADIKTNGAVRTINEIFSDYHRGKK